MHDFHIFWLASRRGLWSGIEYILDTFRLHANGECSRVIASADAHEQCSCAAPCFREVPQARHSPAESCHGLGCIPPEKMQIRLVRIGTEIEAATAAVETLLERRGAVWDCKECGGAPTV